MLISRNTFLVEEIEVFHAVMRSREYNKVDKEEMVDLLQCVRLSEIEFVASRVGFVVRDLFAMLRKCRGTKKELS